MAEEVIPKKTGAERQAEILVAALERAAKNEGILLNSTQKLSPNFYNKQLRITPVNALMMAMHSDSGEFKTNSYTLFNETHDRGEAVKKGQKGVPFVWTNTNEYVSKDNPDKKISRKEFSGLTDEDKAKYKPNPREDTYTVFNIDQTTMSSVHKKDYDKQVAQYGGVALRPEKQNNDTQLRIKFNDFLLNIKENLVNIRKDTTGIAQYDVQKDVVHTPAQKNFATYGDYVQEVHRQIVQATGIPQRLNREGAVSTNGKQPTTEQQHHETLVAELASAHKMLELGLPAKLRPETQQALPEMIAELKEHPDVAEKVLHDVNRTVGMIKKAENGEKIMLRETPSEQRQQAWQSQFPMDKVPENFEHINMLKDDEGKWTLAAKPEGERTFATHPTKEDVSMYFDMIKNDHSEEQTAAFRTQFAQKYYAAVAADSSKEVNLFRSNAPQESLNRIEKVNAFKTKDNKILLLATIDGEKQKAMPITQSQWQRLWLADDKKDYKTHLAAILYAEKLAQKKQEQSPERQEEKRKEEKAKEELTKQETKAVAGLVMSPVIRQWKDLKSKHPDALLLFRTGDFYETYKGDAVKASKILGITVNKSNKYHDDEGKPLQMAGFPFHALDTYLPKLIRAGERVAICDQIENHKQKSHVSEEKEEQKQEVKEVVKPAETQQEQRPRGMHR